MNLHVILLALIFFPKVHDLQARKGIFSYSKEDTLISADNRPLLFDSNDILRIIIRTDDLKKLIRDNGDDPSWHEAELVIENPSGTKETFNIKLCTRGNFRKDPMNCNFPPLCVNFKKQEVKNTIFEGQNKLKLVTHCRSRSMQFDQNVLEEYLAYRIYNILTEKSFRVRLAEITYVDKNGRMDMLTRHGFFIEDEDDMAVRNYATHLETDNLPQQYMDFFYQDLLSVFQYMIGNTDWSVPARHNIKLIQGEEDQRPVPVPFDFDWSGFVCPVYAKPSENLGIKSVEERLFRGFSKDLENYNRIFQLFYAKKDEIYAIIQDCPLDMKNCRRAEKYIDEFYAIISNEQKANLEFVVQGRNPGKTNWGK